ncbi:hypothetical protein GGR54DRAFT_651129 [Hypoxylon sp. NC1633]|nr:hypothetical protein GGR54DRAFT_651129 [Hypoxylon sp. NC1633]
MSRAMEESAPLKAEIRLAQAISEFVVALPDHERAAFKSMNSGSPPSPEDVVKCTEQLNRDGLRVHQNNWRPYGPHLIGILDRVRLLSKAGDILVGASQCMVAGGIWAVVRVSLQIATATLSFFDQVTRFYTRAGKLSSILVKLALLFSDSSDLRNLMYEYFITMVKASLRVVVLSKKSSLSFLAATMTASFDRDFKAFEEELERWASLIDRTVTYLSVASEQLTQSMVKTILSHSTPMPKDGERPQETSSRFAAQPSLPINRRRSL